MPQQQLPETKTQDYQKWLHELKRDDAQCTHNRLDDFAQATNVADIENANL